MITNWLKLTSDMALLGLEAQRIFRPTAVARHALRAAVKLPHALLFPVAHLLLGTIGGNQVGVQEVADDGVDVYLLLPAGVGQCAPAAAAVVDADALEDAGTTRLLGHKAPDGRFQ